MNRLYVKIYFNKSLRSRLDFYHAIIAYVEEKLEAGVMLGEFDLEDFFASDVRPLRLVFVSFHKLSSVERLSLLFFKSSFPAIVINGRAETTAVELKKALANRLSAKAVLGTIHHLEISCRWLPQKQPHTSETAYKDFMTYIRKESAKGPDEMLSLTEVAHRVSEMIEISPEMSNEINRDRFGV